MGKQYRTINTLCLAISMTHNEVDGTWVGQHPLVSRFKGSFQQSSTSSKIFFYMGCRCCPKLHQEFARQQRVVVPKFIAQARYVDGIV